MNRQLRKKMTVGQIVNLRYNVGYSELFILRLLLHSQNGMSAVSHIVFFH